MKPDDVVSEIKLMNIKKISRRTLLLWEKEKLLSPAKRGSGGRGIGAYAEYPEDAAAEFAASWYTMYSDEKKTYSEVAVIREEALSEKDISLKSDKAKTWLELKELAILRLLEREADVIQAQLKQAEEIQGRIDIHARTIVDKKRLESLKKRRENMDSYLKILTENEHLKQENEELRKENAQLKEKCNF